jgi:hypothetical protein
MNILELDTYDLGDAVKFNDRLNPRLFGPDERLRPEVREQLMAIAEDFQQFLGIKDLELKDITISGSNAAYTYTPHSDIDLHLVVDLPEADASEVYRELFDAKKYAYNDQHDITIGGYDVELYVQDANKTHHSQGIYSVLNNDWVAVPKRRRPDVDDISVKSKFEDLGHRIEDTIATGDYEKISALADKIKTYRQAGLDAHGEFGPENLAFKILRTQGLIEKLYAARNAAKDQLLSLDERRKKKRKVRYGYGAYWYPGTAYAGQDHPAGTEGSDGGGDGGESIRESVETADEDILKDFVNFCVKELKIEHMPRVKLRRDPQWPATHRTFGRYNDENKTLEVAWGQRHIMDVLRTVAHELTHKHQHEREGARMGTDAGETGSPYENEANARAGVLMRDYGRLHPEYFSVGQAHDLEEENKISALQNRLPPRLVLSGYTFVLDPTTQEVTVTHGGQPFKSYRYTGPKNYDAYVANAGHVIAGTLPKDLAAIAKRDRGAPTATQRSFEYPTGSGYDIDLPYADIERVYKQHDKDTEGHGDVGGITDLGKWGAIQKRRRREVEKSQDEVKESASGYIPTKAQAKDPRFSMALTVDIKPGQVGKEANKLKLKTDRQGHPQIARADGLFEQLMAEYVQVKEAINAPVAKGKDAEQYYKFILGKARMGRPLTRAEQDYVKMYQVYRQQKLAEDKQISWKMPNFDREYDEVEWQLEHGRGRIPQDVLDFYAKYFSTKQAWLKAVRNGRAVEIPVQFGREIRNNTENKKEWLHALSAQSHDQEGPAKKARVDKLFASGGPIEMPIILNTGQGLWLIGGKTRLGKARLELGIPATVWMIGGKQAVVEDQDLDEVKMSPGALEKFATSDAAKGIRAGFEAELIFRDTQGESDEEDPEPDYDADERAYSIAQVIEFFEQDEYGYGISDRERNRLEENLDETYMNWRDEQMTSDFRNEAEDLVREVYLDETPMGERIIKVLTDGMEIDDAEADKILAVGVDAPKFNSSSEQAAYAEQNPNYKIYLEALDDAEAILDEEVETSIEKQDGYYDQALDDYRDNYSGDDDSFFSDVGLRWMSDIANEYGLDWPVWNMDSRGNSGSRDWDEIGAELQEVVGMPVKVSSNYHSTPRKEGQWIIEPDGSLSPDDRSEEAGLEIVSPPMSLLVTLEKLKAVTDWANDPARGNAYTNASTGLHMGVSLPTRGGDVDYVKLILFMGDNYVKQQFGREANNFCASALDKLRQNIKGGKSDPAGVIKLLKHGLTELAYKELQKGVGTSKYTSAHLQNGYIEFRSPGGDWLAKADEEIDILENTMLRFARAMAIAGDPSADRQEYAKKLYKLVTADNEQYADQLRLFSEYSAGTIDKEQLKKQWAERTIGKEKEINQRWKLYQKVNGTWTPVPAAEWNGYTEDQVKNAVWSKYGREALDSGEYQLVNMGEQEWEVYDVKTGKTLEVIKGKSKGEVADAVYDKYVDQGIGFQVRPYEDPAKLTPRAKLAKRITTKPKTETQYNYDIVDQRTVELRVVDRFRAETPQEAEKIYSQWLQSKDLPDDTANYGYRKSAQAADNQKDSVDLQRRLGVQDVDTDVAQNFGRSQDATQRSGSWSIYDVTLGREISRMDNVPWQQASDRADELERSTGHNMSVRGLSESIDPISGAGAVPPRQDPKGIGKKAVTPAEKVFKNPVKGQPYRSAIGQAISQRDLENMTQQIQVARKLGDSVMEMEDTPPEVLRALDQAAQKNGYRNWADVKANPRSSSAVMTVAKLASTIMRTTGPHHEKLFYKNKTDMDENFADGKVKGKSRPGRVKRSGASCNGSVTDLRARAKRASGEKAKMYHWCANMKSGKKK